MFAKALVSRNQISNITNSSGLIKITTSGVHGLSTGDKVIVAAVSGTAEANGYWTVTVTSTTEFTLDSSAYTNAWSGGGGVYDGVSYAIVCSSAPASPGLLLVADVKRLSSGIVSDVDQVVKQITSTTETEFLQSQAGVPQSVAILTVTNNSAGSITGSIKLRSTKSAGNVAQPRVPFVLPAGYTLVVGGDGVRSMYKETSLPYTS